MVLCSKVWAARRLSLGDINGGSSFPLIFVLVNAQNEGRDNIRKCFERNHVCDVFCNTPILGCHQKLENERIWQKRIIIENVLIKNF